MTPAESRAQVDESAPPAVEVPEYRPLERFWPYLDLPEQPTDDELANLRPACTRCNRGALSDKSILVAR